MADSPTYRPIDAQSSVMGALIQVGKGFGAQLDTMKDFKTMLLLVSAVSFSIAGIRAA